MNTHGLDRLEWGRLTSRLAQHADTLAGKALVAGLTPDPHPDSLDEQHRLFAGASAHAPFTELSLVGAVDLAPLVDRAAKGGVLVPASLWAVMVTVERGQALKAALAGLEGGELARHLGHFEVPASVRAHIAAAILESGAVKDSASAALQRIRQDMGRLESEIQEVLERLLRSPAWADYLQEPLVTVRRGRRVVPVKRSFSHQVGGLVHDQSGSGQTVFVEPAPVVERQNRIAELAAAEAEEVERILRQLTAEVAAHQSALTAMNRCLLAADVMLAKVRWAHRAGAALPTLGGEALSLVEARHPLLDEPVPLTLAVGGERRALVITGPNTGGKTVALKTTGLLVALALSGWPITAHPQSTVPIFQETFADIGDEQSLEQNLSTFSGHVRQLVPIVDGAAPGVLVLLDEIGAGTDPEEGAALALALVDHLLASGATAVVTTHYARVKLLAYRDRRVENARMDFDREQLAPTYRLVMGQPGSSQALYIARRLGLAPALLDRAEAYLGQDGVRVDHAIGELERVERELADARDRVVAAERNLAAREAALAAAEDRLRTEQAQDRDRLRQEVRRRLAELEGRAQAAIAAANAETRAERERALTTLREEVRSWGAVAADLAGAAGSGPAAPGSWAVGQWVVAPPMVEPGRILSMDREQATVESGGRRIVLPIGSLQPAPARPDPRRGGSCGGVSTPSAGGVGLECDLRGMTVLEAVDEVEMYLDRAAMAGLPFARLIHGKGTGSLRRAVQEHLVGHPHVAGFRLGQAGEGGDGVTVVQLRD